MYGCDVPQNDPHGSPSGLAGHGCCTRAVMIGVRAVRLGLFHTLPLRLCWEGKHGRDGHTNKVRRAKQQHARARERARTSASKK